MRVFFGACLSIRNQNTGPPELFDSYESLVDVCIFGHEMSTEVKGEALGNQHMG